MPDSDSWEKFLKLVPKASLQQPVRQPHADAVEVERQVSAQFEAALQQHMERVAQFTQATRREVWQPPAPPQEYLAGATNMRQWLTYCASFDAAAERLRAAGRPAFSERLRFVKEDTEKALVIWGDMAKASGVSLQQSMEIEADATRKATEVLLRMNRETQKIYDAANEKWRRGR